jgi:hypothetical protein
LHRRRAVMSTVVFAVTVAMTAALVLFLGSAAQAVTRAPRPLTSKAQAKGPAPRQLAELIASDAWTGDEFGWSVSVSGSTAVVGAPSADSYSGAAYVFSKVKGSWTQVAELDDPADGNSDEFGWSVSISGSTIVVGSPGYYYDIGSAYVFTDTGGSWTQQAVLAPSNGAGLGGTKFGYSVVTQGSTIMVGAEGASNQTGAVYGFQESGGSWNSLGLLTGAPVESGDKFGWSMALSGKTLVVSAVRHDDTGAVFVFTDIGGTWPYQTTVTSNDGTDDDYFGDKVATNGRRIVAGAPGHNKEQGATYIFDGSGAKWTQVGEVTASDGGPDDCFGWAVGLSGTTVLVGAEQTNSDSGAAYVFAKKGSRWVQTAELNAGDGGMTDEFGYSANLSGSMAIIGADQSEGGAGSAYLYSLAPQSS